MVFVVVAFTLLLLFGSSHSPLAHTHTRYNRANTNNGSVAQLLGLGQDQCCWRWSIQATATATGSPKTKDSGSELETRIGSFWTACHCS